MEYNKENIIEQDKLFIRFLKEIKKYKNKEIINSKEFIMWNYLYKTWKLKKEKT